MSRNRWRFSKPTIAIGIFALAVGLLAGLTALISGKPALGGRMGLVDDWTHHHLVFSSPGTAADALAQGRVEHWYRTVNDPRYVMQVMKRNAAQRALAPAGDFAPLADRLGAPIGDRAPIWRHPPPTPKQTLKRDWSMSMGSGAKVAAGMFPAKFSFSDTAAFCDSNTTPDFAVYPTGLAGSTTQASIIAYDNLYSGCSGLHPLVYWQYNTNGGTIVTSPVVSLDGTQVAFMQTVSSAAYLVLLKWSKNSSLVQMTASPQVVAAANYRGCTAPCMTAIAFATTANDTNSSPFYDYNNDVIYVGDNSSTLHKFQYIFNSGTPAEITGGGASSGWPQYMTSSTTVPPPAPSPAETLTSPVYDPTSGSVFVGGASGDQSRRLYHIPAGGGYSNVVPSVRFDSSSANPGFVDAPLVDSSAGMVYGFLNDDGGTPNAAVVQFPVAFATGASGTKQTLGQGDTTATDITYSGAFDNIYLTSTATSPTGNLYVCGRASGTQIPTLYQVPITANVLGTPVIGPALATGTANCSPVTEIYNPNASGGAKDWIFLSVTATSVTASPISCSATTGCIMSFDVTSASGFGTSKATASTLAATSGTSGTVIDNTVGSSTLAGASQVYFSPLANQACAGNNGTNSTGYGTSDGCAVQASQASLQ